MKISFTLGGTMVLGDPQGVVKQGNIRVGTSAPPFSEIADAGDIIVVAGNHENQTIAAEHGASCLIVSEMLQLLRTSLIKA